MKRECPPPPAPLKRNTGGFRFNTVTALRFPALTGRQSCHFLESGPLYPPQAALGPLSPRTPLKRHKGRGPGPRLWNPTTGGWPGARRHGRLIRPGALLPAAPGVFLAELRPRIWELGIHRGAKRTHFASLSAGAGWIKEKGGRMPSFQSVEKVRLELGFFL